MELVLKSANINLPKEIANLEALKAELAPKLEHYSSLVMTEDSIKAAKADKANLNKLRTAIEDQRKTAKKMYLEPYNILEAQCKEVVALIDVPIQVIDKQLKAFDEAEKDEKFAALEAFFNSLPHEDFITMSDVLNPKWANKTEKLDALKADMMSNTQKISAEYEQLNKLYENFPHKLVILNHYKTDKDFSQTMVYAKNLEYEYEKEKAKQAENVQNAKKHPEVSDSEVIPSTEQISDSVSSEQSQDINTESKIITGKFEVAGTAEQIKALGAFMKSNNIKFTVIKD